MSAFRKSYAAETGALEDALTAGDLDGFLGAQVLDQRGDEPRRGHGGLERRGVPTRSACAPKAKKL